MATTAFVGGVAIFGIKLYSFFFSGSVALLSDALESIVNIVASLMMYMSVVISERPPDENHSYGHQKIENLSSLAEGGGLVLVAGALIAREAVGRLYQPVPLVSLDAAICLSLFATLLNGAISWMLMSKARETGSMALEGDAKHLLSDVVSRPWGWPPGSTWARYSGSPCWTPSWR